MISCALEQLPWPGLKVDFVNCAFSSSRHLIPVNARQLSAGVILCSSMNMYWFI